ncbi:MAG: glycosyltransferase [Cyanobacteriota bacterium]
MEEKKKYKITQISKYYYPFSGGLELVAKQISEIMKDNGYKVEVIACSESINTSSDTVNNIPVKRCGRLFEFKSNPISPGLIWELSKVDTDILHYHHPFIFAAIAHFIARPKYKYLVTTYHGDITRQKRIMKIFNPIYKAFLNKVDKIHVLAEEIINNSNTLSDVNHSRDNYSIIPLGINTSDFLNYDHAEVKEIRSKYTNKSIILFVGRLSGAKGLEFLIQSMHKVSDNCILLIIGGGLLEEKLKNLITENSLDNKIIMLNTITGSQLVSYYHACDVFVLPSIAETFGIVQLEAMICGKPVINTSLNTGVNHVSIHNKTGLTVEPGNVSELATAINSLISDNKLRTRLGTCAQERVLNYFTLDKIGTEYLQFYSSLIKP